MRYQFQILAMPELVLENNSINNIRNIFNVSVETQEKLDSSKTKSNVSGSLNTNLLKVVLDLWLQNYSYIRD